MRLKQRDTRPGPLGGLLPPLNFKEILRALIVFGLGAVVVSVLMFKPEQNSPEPRDWQSAPGPEKAENQAISRSLFTGHAATLLVISLLLLVAILGGVMLAKEVD
jgi:NADH:ubiquinone oxidoreductase subunit 6 (subunit J)